MRSDYSVEVIQIHRPNRLLNLRTGKNEQEGEAQVDAQEAEADPEAHHPQQASEDEEQEEYSQQNYEDEDDDYVQQ